MADHKVLQEHRCFCHYKPIMGMVVQYPNGKIAYNIRIYKSKRLFGEVFIEDGTAKVRCRDCFRLHTVKFVRETPTFDAVEDTVAPS